MPTPTQIKLHKKSKTLELHFGSETFLLPAEYLRVLSPSAEVRGHGRGQEVLQFGKCNVGINQIEAQGNYAIKLIFDDSHDTGIYTWEYLYKLGADYDLLWAEYLALLNKAGKSRDPDVAIVKLFS